MYIYSQRKIFRDNIFLLSKNVGGSCSWNLLPAALLLYIKTDNNYHDSVYYFTFLLYYYLLLLTTQQLLLFIIIAFLLMCWCQADMCQNKPGSVRGWNYPIVKNKL